MSTNIFQTTEEKLTDIFGTEINIGDKIEIIGHEVKFGKTLSCEGLLHAVDEHRFYVYLTEDIKETALKKGDLLKYGKKIDNKIYNFSIKKIDEIVLHLPITSYRPEEIRVIKNSNNFLVESKIPERDWITQKNYTIKEDAIKDAESWYKK